MNAPTKAAKNDSSRNGGGLAAGKTAGEIISSAGAGASEHGDGSHSVDADSRHQRIAAAAYRRAEQRGFVAGNELDDWLAAEREIDANDS